MKRDIVVVLGSFPPPMGGAAKNTKIVVDALQECIRTEKINTSVGELAHARSISFHIRRLFRTLCCTIKLIRFASIKNKVLYVVPDGGLGMIYTFIYAVSAMLCNYTVFFHHRTFLYIDRFSFLMFCTVKWLHPNSSHVFLSPGMLASYESKYGTVSKRYVCDNSSFVTPEAVQHRPDDQLVLGHLSNLCTEKGFFEVCRVFEILMEKEVDVSLTFAGKPQSSDVSNKLQSLMKSWGDRITFLDFIDGVKKDQFYRSVDVFLFPTRFPQEAQPNVIYEAMAKQCICVTWGRACIPEMYSRKAGMVISVDTEYTHAAVKFIEKLDSNPSLRARYRSETLLEIGKKKDLAVHQFSTLIRAMVYTA